MSDPARQVDELRAQFERDLAAPAAEPELRVVRDRYLARKGGLVSALLKALGSAPAEERPRLGQLANQLKQEIEAQARPTALERGANATRGRPAPSTSRCPAGGPRSAIAIR